ncbi:hypothetical protein [Phenylobacterium sp.]|uniref:hypothetical protein n=1 Tax=Phenylobacterium sp. TaxID=1871053 RepID=UPI002E35CE0A|nr:hypothetical protein [Phenylobacterium sp.]HEX3365491.1 hypothetical protein [Phenylobacterium sp.]
MAIAAIAPFDVAFTAATFGSPLLRMALIASLALIGAFSADRAGFQLAGHDVHRSILVGSAAAIVVAIYVIALDAFMFRSSLPASYVQFIKYTSLQERLAYFMLRAFNENVIYRLFVFSTATYAISRIRGVKASELAPALVWGVMIATQLLNISLNVILQPSAPLTPMALVYDVLRYVAPGVLWAWLFRRYGFMTAEIASVGCHVFLQPALGWLI